VEVNNIGTLSFGPRLARSDPVISVLLPNPCHLPRMCMEWIGCDGRHDDASMNDAGYQDLKSQSCPLDSSNSSGLSIHLNFFRLLLPMCLAKSGCDDEWKDKRRVGVHLSKRSASSRRMASLGFTFTLSAPARIFPQDTASSGRAPESEPSY